MVDLFNVMSIITRHTDEIFTICHTLQCHLI